MEDLTLVKLYNKIFVKVVVYTSTSTVTFTSEVGSKRSFMDKVVTCLFLVRPIRAN
jgi:hypothetical protein